MLTHKKVLFASLGLGMAAMVAVPVTAFAAASSKPAGTVIKASLKPGTKMTFKGTIDGAAITVTCSSFSSSGKVPSGSPLTLPISPPKISGCSDSLGGSDTIKTTGSWSMTESKSKPYTMTLTIPKKGATFNSNILSSCTIIVAPTAPDPVKGSYNGTSTATYTNGKIPTTGNGCTSTSATTSGTLVLSPAPGVPPF